MDTPTTKLTVEQQLKWAEDLLDRYKKVSGIGELFGVSEVQRYLRMREAEINKLPATECGVAAVLLCQEAAFIQTEINKHQAIMDWCERSINVCIAGTVTGVGDRYTPFEYRRELAIKENEVATKLNDISREYKLLVDSMAYIPTTLRNLASKFESLQQTKRGMRT